jgi:hypothetical protein
VLDDVWSGQLERGEVVVIGDMLNRDVLGARRMGMKTILLEMDVFADKSSSNARNKDSIAPDRTITDIRQVPSAIDQINADFLLNPQHWNSHEFRPFTVPTPSTLSIGAAVTDVTM